MSASSSRPVSVQFTAPVRKIVSSKGSDGHSLAIGKNGEVWSWGDGDYGKLGHGDSTTQKQPTQIQEQLKKPCLILPYKHEISLLIKKLG